MNPCRKCEGTGAVDSGIPAIGRQLCPWCMGGGEAPEGVDLRRCRCDMRTKLLGDGCQFCNPEGGA